MVIDPDRADHQEAHDIGKVGWPKAEQLCAELPDASVIPRPNPSEQLVLAFEYWDGKRWRHLGRSAPRGALPGSGDELGFHDDTKALSRDEVVAALLGEVAEKRIRQVSSASAGLTDSGAKFGE